MQKALCFIGRSGSGKGTVSAILAHMLGWPVLSTGDLVRAEAKRSSALGRRCAEILAGGKFLSGDEVLLLYRHALITFSRAPGIIFEGSPRSAVEARFLASEMEAIFILLDTPEEVCRHRLLRVRQRHDDTLENISNRFAEFGRVFPEIEDEVELWRVDGNLTPQEIVRSVYSGLSNKFSLIPSV